LERQKTALSELVAIANDYVVQGRSNFQLKNFVIGQHDTPEMRYRQIIIECKDLLYKIAQAEIALEIGALKLAKLEESDDEIDKLKVKKRKMQRAVAQTVIEGTKRELAYLVELAKDYRHYTPSEIEANQPEYWELRLTRQATTDRMALEQGVSAGNLASMINAGLIQKELSA
jgi:hypothetical protein